MRRPRRTFSAEFKAEAVKLITERGYSITQACKELDVGETALRRWVSQVQAECQGYVLPGSKPINPEQQRIRELENCTTLSVYAPYLVCQKVSIMRV